MRNIWIIARKEYKNYFISPIAYAVMFMILLILGIIFYANVVAAAMQSFAPNVQIVIGPMVSLFLFTTPAITMRALAEEQRTGTLELLLTAPVRDAELVIGKWLGGLLFYITILIISLIYPLILNQLVQPGIDQGMLIAGYLGITLLVGTFIAIGVATSSLFSNQIAAFFAALGVLLIFWMIGFPAQALGSSGGLLNYLDMSGHFYNTFFEGIIELRDVIYYLSATGLALFLGSLSVETRRWR